MLKSLLAIAVVVGWNFAVIAADPALYKNNPTIGDIVNDKKAEYSGDEALKLVKQEVDLAGLLLGMGNKEEATRHIERAKEIAGDNGEIVSNLDGLLKDLNGGSMENAKQRMAEILAK